MLRDNSAAATYERIRAACGDPDLFGFGGQSRRGWHERYARQITRTVLAARGQLNDESPIENPDALRLTCPRPACAEENLATATHCRACGTHLGLFPLTNQDPAASFEDGDRVSTKGL